MNLFLPFRLCHFPLKGKDFQIKLLLIFVFSFNVILTFSPKEGRCRQTEGYRKFENNKYNEI